MEENHRDRKEAGIGQDMESIAYPGVCFHYPNWGLGKGDRHTAGSRERGQAAAYTLVFTWGQGGAGGKAPGGKEVREDEGARPGIIKAVGKGIVQPSVRDVKGTQCGCRGRWNRLFWAALCPSTLGCS